MRVASPAPLPDFAGLFLWAATPFRALGTADLYGLLGPRVFTTRGMYLNLGYWAAAGRIDDACPALATLVAETAQMGPEDRVVDVGFGFADQDMLWAERFRPRHITGLNITPLHVRVGRARVRRRGLAGRITLRLGSATAMPLPDACCDVVTAVECAFHFDTRDAFLAEAQRVLRPGGRLVLADIIQAAPVASPLGRRWQAFTWAQLAEKFRIPPANAVQPPEYAALLAAAGFTGVRLTPISAQVFPGWHRALAEEPALFRRLPLAARLPYRLLLQADAAGVYAGLEYVLAFARKPG